MWGPNEFTCIGPLRYWDVRDRLHKVSLPCLVTTGKYDEVAPTIARGIHRTIKGSKLVVLERSGHLTMWDDREKNIDAVRGFLESVAPELRAA
jgi:pimeloyl-ACP methyl ester carboxylesterase